MLRDAEASAWKSSTYGLPQSVMSPAFEPSHADRNEARRLYHRAAADIADPVVQISPPEAVNRRSATWPGMRAEIVQANRRGRIHLHFCAPVHLLVMYERSVRHEGGTSIQGLPPLSTVRDCSRKFIFVPAGHEFRDWQEPRTLPRVVLFYFHPTQFASNTELGFSDTCFAPRLFFEDRALWDTASKLRTLIESGGSDHRCYLEALGIVLVHELVRLNTGRGFGEVPGNGSLAAWQRRKTADYIEEHLAEPISLADLAQLVDLSPNWFCHAFSQSFGMPPLRYHAHQRIERAKALLARRGESVTEVGLAVGYSEASAFSTAFRRVTGMTPSSYRRGLR